MAMSSGNSTDVCSSDQEKDVENTSAVKQNSTDRLTAELSSLNLWAGVIEAPSPFEKAIAHLRKTSEMALSRIDATYRCMLEYTEESAVSKDHNLEEASNVTFSEDPALPKSFFVGIKDVRFYLGMRVSILAWVHGIRRLDKDMMLLLLLDGEDLLQCACSGKLCQTKEAVLLAKWNVVRVTGAVGAVPEGRQAPKNLELSVDFWEPIGDYTLTDEVKPSHVTEHVPLVNIQRLFERRRAFHLNDMEHNAELKQNFKNLTVKMDPKDEIAILSDLAEKYAIRSESSEKIWSDPVKAHGLYNACRVRDTAEQADHWLEKASKVERQYLNYERPPQFRRIDCKHREMLQYTREEIRKELSQVRELINFDADDETFHMEGEFCRHMRRISQSCTDKMKSFTACVLNDCIEMLGPPPCGLAVVGMGSLARGMMTPYSDLEYMFLIEDDRHRLWFRRLAILSYFTIANMGETPLKCLSVEELSPLFDDRSSNGFKIDGLNRIAGNIPTGDEASDGFNLISTPKQLCQKVELQLMNPKLEPCKIGDFTDLIDSIVLIVKHGNGEELFKAFVDETRNIPRNKERIKATIEMLKLDLEMLNFLPHDDFLGDKRMNLKSEVFRYPTILLYDLKILQRLSADSVWEALENISQTNGWTVQMKHAFEFLLAGAIYLRLNTYFHHNSQSGLATVLLPSDETDETYYNIPKCLFVTLSSYMFPVKRLFKERVKKLHLDSFQIAFKKMDVQRDLSRGKAFSLAFCLQYGECLKLMESLKDNDKDEFSVFLCGSASYHTGQFTKACHYFQQLLEINQTLYGKDSEHPAVASCYDLLGTVAEVLGEYGKAQVCFQKSLTLKQIIHGEIHSHPDLARSYLLLGNMSMALGAYEQARSLYQQSLEMSLKVYWQTPVHATIAGCYQSLGQASEHLGEYEKACEYYEQSLEIKQKIHGSNTAHPELAASYHSLGTLSENFGKYERACQYYERAIGVLHTVYGNEPHRDLSSSLHQLGNVYTRLGVFEKAYEYYQMSSAMNLKLYGADKAHPSLAASYHQVGVVSEQLGDFETAFKCYEQSLEMELRIYGNDSPHPDVALSYYQLGNISTLISQYANARMYHLKSLEMREKLYGSRSSHPAIADSLHQLGIISQELGEYEEARGYYQHSLDLRERIYGQDAANPDLASSHHQLGNISLLVGDYENARTRFQRSLQISVKTFGPNTDHPQVGNSYYQLGMVLKLLGDYEKAHHYCHLSLDMSQRLYGANKPHRDTANCYHELGSVSYALGDYKKARDYYQQSLDMKLKIYGYETPHAHIANVYHNLASVFAELRETENARQCSKRALEMRLKLYGPNNAHPDLVASYINLGNISFEVGDHSDALHFYLQSKEMCEKIYSQHKAHPNWALSLFHVGKVSMETGELRTSCDYLHRSLEMYQRFYGQNPHSDLAANYFQLGLIMKRLGEPDKACGYYQQALKMRQAIYGLGHSEVAASYHELGNLSFDYGKFEESLPFYQNAVKMFETTTGQSAAHPTHAASHFQLGRVYAELHNHERALDCFQRALHIFNEVYGPTAAHPHLAVSHQQLGLASEALGKFKEARGYYQHSLRIVQSVYGLNVPHQDLVTIYQQLGVVSEKLGDYEASLDFIKQAKEMEQRLRAEGQCSIP